MQCRSLKRLRDGDPNVAYGDKAQPGDGKWRKREKSQARRGRVEGGRLRASSALVSVLAQLISRSLSLSLLRLLARISAG